MDYHSTQLQECYNMDEKGFLMSYLQKVITVFPKASMQSRYSEPLVRMGQESG